MLKVHSLTVLLGLVLLAGPAVCQSTLPVRYNATTLEGDGEGCPTTDQRNTVRANITEGIRTLLQNNVLPLIRGNPVYGACGCGGPGWSRIAYLNMTDPTEQCPPNWKLFTSPKRSCGRSTTSSGSCDSATFSVGGLQYSQVCGRIIAYQIGSTDAFRTRTSNIDSFYVDGVSVTHGSPQQHIWTFVAALDETRTDQYVCPCTNINNPTTEFNIPSFVGGDYFCETGVPTGTTFRNGYFYPNGDRLWDGEGCGPSSTCCTFNNPPWFCKQLPQTTTDDMEVSVLIILLAMRTFQLN